MVNVFNHPWFERSEGLRVVNGESYKSRCPLEKKLPEWDGRCGMKGCPDYPSCPHAERYRNREQSANKMCL
jgi:hypothetical protein